MNRYRFDERIAHLHITYDPNDPAAKNFGPIRVGLPGSVVNMTVAEAEIAAGFFMGVVAIARRHAENHLVCPPDCPDCECAMESTWYRWRCPECDRRMERRVME